MASVINFKIVEHIGIIGEGKNGWNKELNIVEWSYQPPRLDLRSWSPDHTSMSKGITLSDDELRELIAIGAEYLGD